MKAFLLAMLFLEVAAFMRLAFAYVDGVKALIDRCAGVLP